MRQLLLLALFTLISRSPLVAQEITNVKATALVDSVEISYTLIDSTGGRYYQVEVWAFTATDTLQLNAVAGAVGDSIVPGQHKLIWRAYEEWGPFRGAVALEVRAVPLFSFHQPNKDTIQVRRARGVSFAWYGENSTLDTLRIELYRYDEKIKLLTGLNNVGTYAWRVDPKLPIGEGYRIKLTGLDKSGVSAYSPYFTVKPRYPLAAKIAVPVAAVGAYIGYLSLRLLPDPDDEPTTLQDDGTIGEGD